MEAAVLAEGASVAEVMVAAEREVVVSAVVEQAEVARAVVVLVVAV